MISYLFFLSNKCLFIKYIVTLFEENLKHYLAAFINLNRNIKMYSSQYINFIYKLYVCVLRFTRK